MASKAGLFSTTLTAFIVDSKQDLKPSPQDETVYYLRQHSTILLQISGQLSSIAPQVAIPSTSPPPFPPFSPLASDVRVNVFWFMALAFSLLSALLAILVQQWVRNYMHVFQRYGDPLKSSRLRQYLYEGCERWYMPMIAEAVPKLLHISLFLFFAGLGHSLLNINTKVALSTIVPISVSSLLYIFTTFAPIVYPQSPYQNSFSGIFWYLIQKSCSRRFKYRGSDGEMKCVSTNMAQRQMQLAMEETEARKDRDERAIRWLIDNLTEDAEMEKFLSAIPGSFNTDWGTEVWERVGKHHESEDQSQNEPLGPHTDTTSHHPPTSWSIRSVLGPFVDLVGRPAPRHPTHPATHATTRSPVPPNDHPHSTAQAGTGHVQGEDRDVVHELSIRVARSVEMCKNHKLLENNVGFWRKRTRACIEVTASLVCCANAKLAWFGGILNLLGDIGCFEQVRELSSAGTDELFVMRWTCLSLVAIRQILAHYLGVSHSATLAIESFAEEDDSSNNDDLAGAQKIDETFQRANDCLFQLYDALRYAEDLTEDVKEILRGREIQILELEQIDIEADRLQWIDGRIGSMQDIIKHDSCRIISQFPGVLDNFEPYYHQAHESIPFSRLVELSRDLHKLQFICPGKTLKSMCSPSLILRNILDGQGDADAYKDLRKHLGSFRSSSGWQGDEMQRQLWRLQDLGDGGGLGFTVELFFLSLSQQLSTSSSNKSHSALYTGTFRATTSGWSIYKHSLGTQKLLLDIALSRRWVFEAHYPAYIVDEFLLLLGNVFEGQTGPHIDEAKQKFETIQQYRPGGFRERVLRVLTSEQAQSPAS